MSRCFSKNEFLKHYFNEFVEIEAHVRTSESWLLYNMKPPFNEDVEVFSITFRRRFVGENRI